MPLSTTVLSRPVLTVRIHAGLNAASLLAGLFTVGGIGLFSSADELLKLHFPKAQASLEVEPVSVNGIGGVTARFETPADILHYYASASNLSEAAFEVARRIWHNVATAEARVHNSPLESVHFHEVGRMTNILAVGLIAEMFTSINRRCSRTSLQRYGRNGDPHRSGYSQGTRRAIRSLARNVRQATGHRLCSRKNV